MPVLLRRLENWGCDIRTALNRLSDDVEFYLFLLRQFPEDPGLVKLRSGVMEKNYACAYEGVHQLKGVASTLGLTPIVEACSLVADDLKTSSPSSRFRGDYQVLHQRIKECLSMIHEEVSA